MDAWSQVSLWSEQSDVSLPNLPLKYSILLEAQKPDTSLAISLLNTVKVFQGDRHRISLRQVIPEEETLQISSPDMQVRIVGLK